MAMTKIERKSFGDEIQAKLANPGDKLEGYYEGSETFELNGKPTTKHRFKNEEGKIVSILGAYQLDADLPTVPKGSFTRITRGEKKRTKRGGTVVDYIIEFESNGL